jgi:RNA polymerase sigma-70 factor (ECF subfamily)
MPEDSVSQLVDHLFRHKAGQMVSALTRLFGVDNLELVEDIVQDTLLKALQQWPYRGIPENPGGWLWQAAKNRARCAEARRIPKMFEGRST